MRKTAVAAVAPGKEHEEAEKGRATHEQHDASGAHRNTERPRKLRLRPKNASQG